MLSVFAAPWGRYWQTLPQMARLLFTHPEILMGNNNPGGQFAILVRSSVSGRTLTDARSETCILVRMGSGSLRLGEPLDPCRSSIRAGSEGRRLGPLP